MRIDSPVIVAVELGFVVVVVAISEKENQWQISL